MINGLGVLGWGVGGIEAEAAMLGQPVSMLIPEVVGFKLHGKLPPGATATDLVLTVTEMLRKKKVVGKFVEFYGNGLSARCRSPIARRSPTWRPSTARRWASSRSMTETLKYLRLTRRGEQHVALVEAYTQGAGTLPHRRHARPGVHRHLELDLGTVEPSLAGPKRPQDRVPLEARKAMFREALAADLDEAGTPARRTRRSTRRGRARRALRRRAPSPTEDEAARRREGRVRTAQTFTLRHGSVVIAAITSCTNTSNPTVMLAAGLLARNAVEKGLKTKPWVKTSLRPGSKVVTDYLRQAGVLEYLDAARLQPRRLRLHDVHRQLRPAAASRSPQAIEENKLVVAAVLSGNRNFEGRVNPLTRFNYLASPPLVVAYALAGRMDIDFDTRAARRRQRTARCSCATSGRRRRK